MLRQGMDVKHHLMTHMTRLANYVADEGMNDVA